MSNQGYSWNNVRYGSRRMSSDSEYFFRWILIAIFLAVLSHVVVMLAMKKMPIFFDSQKKEIITQAVVVRNVDDLEYIKPVSELEIKEMEIPKESMKNLLDELEMLEEAPEDAELDFSPEIETPEILVPIEMPALAGDAESSMKDLTSGIDLSRDIDDPGTTDDFLDPAIGQITIDPGTQAANEFDPDQFNTEIAKGAGGDVAEGMIDGFTPLAEMTKLSQADLENAKGMIGSDLLFDFNKAILRESAKNSLLKLVLIIDKNPNMKCWIEGHTDLIGNDVSNKVLSLARAEAVKYWLIHSMKISQERLYVRGLGKSLPIVMSGNQDEQAINRRVEIKMRKNAPSEDLQEEPSALVKKPMVIKPKRNPNLPEENVMEEEHESTPGKAIPVEEVAKAEIVEPEEAPKAILVEDPIEEVAPKAIPIEEIVPAPEEIIPPKAIPIE